MKAIDRVARLIPALAIVLAGMLASVSALAAHKSSSRGSAASADASKPSPNGPKPLGRFKDWTAYTMEDHGRTICFIVSEPKSKQLSEKKASRGSPYFMVTRWSDSQPLQPSLVMGYTEANDTKTKIKIGDDNYDMFVDGDGAWMESEDGDKKLTDSMRKGATMTITGESSHGVKSTDRYSLAGVSDALDKIADCK
jgi:Invasion associated locus B (IalB) protein